MSDERRLFAWLERVFFGGAELSILSTPGFAVVVFAQTAYPDAERIDSSAPPKNTRSSQANSLRLSLISVTYPDDPDTVGCKSVPDFV